LLWAAPRSVARATRWASRIGQGFAWLLIAWGLYHLVAGDFFGGIWIGLIGMFLNNAAAESYRQVLLRQALRGETVRRFMNPHPITVPPDVDLRHWVEEYVYRHHHKFFLVVTDDRLEGA